MRSVLISILLFLCLSVTAQITGRYPYSRAHILGGENYIDGAIFWLRFTDNYEDETGQHNGTNHGTSISSGRCLFDDTGVGVDYVDMGDFWDAELDTFTLSYLIYFDEDLNEDYWAYGNAIRFVTSQPGMYTVFDNDGASHFEMLSRIADNANDQSYAGTASSACDNDILPDTWHHIIEIYYYAGANQTNWICWVDGLYCHSSGDSIITKPVSWVNAGGALYLGRDHTTNGGLREGAMLDEYMLFEGDLRYHSEGNYVDVLIADPTQMPIKDPWPISDDYEAYNTGVSIDAQGHWVIADGVIDINTHGTKAFDGGENNYNAAYYNMPIGNNQSSQITAYVTDYSSPGPAVRITPGSGGSYYGWFHELNNQSHLVRINNGAPTVLATSATGWTDTDVVRLEIIGDELFCYKNGSLDTSMSGDGRYTDNSVDKLTSGFVGIMNYWQDPNAYGDLWIGDEL